MNLQTAKMLTVCGFDVIMTKQIYFRSCEYSYILNKLFKFSLMPAKTKKQKVYAKFTPQGKNAMCCLNIYNDNPKISKY